jgi:hypothetical protein
MKPERNRQLVSETIEAPDGGAKLSLDATERESPGPLKLEKQAEKYRGKKKTQTAKNLLPVNENTRKSGVFEPDRRRQKAR